jgi:hypothetical protein
MEQDPPENEMPAEYEPMADRHTLDADAEAPAPTADRLELLTEEFGARRPVPDRDQPITPASPETAAYVFDPYTGAPLASPFTEPESPSGSAGPEIDWQDPLPTEDPFTPIPYIPATQTESIRQSGLAWSAGIAFFGSVAFTLFLGWLADLLLGTSPWGIVVGIVLGSMIGFLQFFRITSRIFPAKEDGPDVRPLMLSDKDDE